MLMRIVAVCLAVMLVTGSVARAQDRDRSELWRSYAERLPPHTLVVIQLKNGKSVRGQLVQVTDDRIVVLRKTRIRVPPSEFAELEQYARDQGITHVVAGPLVRSSYHADGQAQLVRDLRAAKVSAR